MTPRALRLALIVGILCVVAAYFVLTRPAAPPPGPATPAASPAGPPQISGTYAEDWMKLCGAVAGEAQKACTERLDKAYGRSAGAPVPPPANR